LLATRACFEGKSAENEYLQWRGGVLLACVRTPSQRLTAAIISGPLAGWGIAADFDAIFALI
jgi:hypothetical protein